MSMMIFTLLMTLEEKNYSKLSAISRTPLFGKKIRQLSKIFCKNRSTYRRINTNLNNFIYGFLKLIFTSATVATLPLGFKTDYKRENDKDNITYLALFKCKASNHFVYVVTFFTKKWIMFISYIFDASLIKLNHDNAQISIKRNTQVSYIPSTTLLIPLSNVTSLSDLETKNKLSN